MCYFTVTRPGYLILTGKLHILRWGDAEVPGSTMPGILGSGGTLPFFITVHPSDIHKNKKALCNQALFTTSISKI